jgi:hypothetical protein
MRAETPEQKLLAHEVKQGREYQSTSHWSFITCLSYQLRQAAESLGSRW